MRILSKWRQHISEAVLVLVLSNTISIFGATARYLTLASGFFCLFYIAAWRRNLEVPLCLLLLQVGLGPLLGWIPYGTIVVDVPLIAAIVAIKLSWKNQYSLTEIDRRSLGLILILPIIVIGLYWRAYLGGNSDLILAQLISGWDHSVHFWIFWSNQVFGTYAPLVNLDHFSGLHIVGRTYPSGMHFFLGQLFRSTTTQEQATLNQIVEYSRGVVLVQIISYSLILLAIARLIQGVRAIWFVFATSLFCTYLMTVGLLGIGVSNGYPNFILAIAASATAVSLAIRRCNTQVVQNVSIWSALLIVAYNWYPLMLPILPVLLISLYEKNQQFRLKRSEVIFGLLGSASILAPVAQTISLGRDHVEDPIQLGMLSTSSAVFMAVVVIAASLIGTLTRTSTSPDKLVAFSCASGLAVIAFISYLEYQTGGYPYYAEKFSIGVLMVVAFVFPMWFINNNYQINNGGLAFVKAQLLTLCTLVFLVTLIGSFKLDFTPSSPGYVGRNRALEVTESEIVAARLLIAATKVIPLRELRETPCFYFPLVAGTESIFDDIRSNQILLAYWANALSGTFTEDALEKSLKLPSLINQNEIDPESDCPIMLNIDAKKVSRTNAKLAKSVVSVDL